MDVLKGVACGRLGSLSCAAYGISFASDRWSTEANDMINDRAGTLALERRIPFAF